MPTAQRAPAALLLRRGGDRLLFDCGEGTQRQLQRSSVGLAELEEVFLSHFHADHFLGLPGMLKTFALRGRTELPLTVYGPRGLRDLFGRLRPFVGRLPYELTLVELAPGEALERGDHRIEAFAVDHGASSLGYALVEDERPGRFDVATADALGVPPGPERGLLQRGETVTLPDGRVVTADEVVGAARPGRKVVITGDTAPSATVVQAAHGADLLVHEATFAAEERERAAETQHSTAGRGGRGGTARRRPAARAHARLHPLLRPGAPARGPGGLPGHGRPARLRRDRDPVPRAGPARAAQGRRASRTGRAAAGGRRVPMIRTR